MGSFIGGYGGHTEILHDYEQHSTVQFLIRKYVLPNLDTSSLLARPPYLCLAACVLAMSPLVQGVSILGFE